MMDSLSGEITWNAEADVEKENKVEIDLDNLICCLLLGLAYLILLLNMNMINTYQRKYY